VEFVCCSSLDGSPLAPPIVHSLHTDHVERIIDAVPAAKNTPQKRSAMAVLLHRETVVDVVFSDIEMAGSVQKRQFGDDPKALKPSGACYGLNRRVVSAGKRFLAGAALRSL
jgi:hypothetical protein